MKTHPIIFSTTMVQAILEGRKTMTRRIVKPQPYVDDKFRLWTWDGPRPKAKRNTGAIASTHLDSHLQSLSFCGKYQPGDVLWVRESFYEPNVNFLKGKYFYKCDLEKQGWNFKWKSPIHMPKVAARIFLEVVSIRVERMEDIRTEDIIKEGLPKNFEQPSPAEWYRELWEKINGTKSLKANPWVWVIEFKRIEKPENF